MNTARLSRKRLFSSAFFHMRHMLSGIFFVLSAVILLVTALIKPNAFSILRAQVTEAAVPVISALTSPVTYVQTTLQDIKNTLNLREENARLLHENQQLTAWYLSAQSIIAENEALKKLTNVTSLETVKTIPALTTVILKDTSHDFSQSLLIKAGKTQGVHKNAVALSSYGLIGRVIESADHSARVLLLTDINARIPVVINLNGTLVQAIMAGQNEAAPILTHIADKLMIERLAESEGVHIMTSGTGGIFPYGVPVGTLKPTENGALTVAPYMHHGQFQYVTVLDKAIKTLLPDLPQSETVAPADSAEQTPQAEAQESAKPADDKQTQGSQP